MHRTKILLFSLLCFLEGPCCIPSSFEKCLGRLPKKAKDKTRGHTKSQLVKGTFCSTNTAQPQPFQPTWGVHPRPQSVHHQWNTLWGHTFFFFFYFCANTRNFLLMQTWGIRCKSEEIKVAFFCTFFATATFFLPTIFPFRWELLEGWDDDNWISYATTFWSGDQHRNDSVKSWLSTKVQIQNPDEAYLQCVPDTCGSGSWN